LRLFVFPFITVRQVINAETAFLKTLWIESQQPVEEDVEIKIPAAGIPNFGPFHHGSQ